MASGFARTRVSTVTGGRGAGRRLLGNRTTSVSSARTSVTAGGTPAPALATGAPPTDAPAPGAAFAATATPAGSVAPPMPTRAAAAPSRAHDANVVRPRTAPLRPPRRYGRASAAAFARAAPPKRR